MLIVFLSLLGSSQLLWFNLWSPNILERPSHAIQLTDWHSIIHLYIFCRDPSGE